MTKDPITGGWQCGAVRYRVGWLEAIFSMALRLLHSKQTDQKAAKPQRWWSH